MEATKGIVLVSHSKKLAEGLAELVEEMNDGSVKIIPAGGAEGGRIGTNAMTIREALEALEACTYILMYVDLGSAIMSAETAMDMVDDELREKIQIVNAPVVEGAFAGVVQACVSDDPAEVVKASEEARNIQKC